MMSAKCPECDLELNEQLECAQCGFTATALLFEQAGSPAEEDLTFAGAPAGQNVLVELEATSITAGENDTPELPAGGGEAWGGPQERAGDDDSSPGDGGNVWSDAEAPGEAGRDEVKGGGAGEDPWLPAAGISSVTTLTDESSVGSFTPISVTGEGARINVFNSSLQKDDEERALIEFTEALPPKSPRLPDFVSEELSEYLEKLKEERLILISCPDEDIAFSAAHALIGGLYLPQGGQRLLLNIDKSAVEGSLPSVYYLRRKSGHDKETVVLVDAATEKARPFLEPIIYAARASSAAIQDDLRRNDMYLLCLIDPALVEAGTRPADGGPRRARELKFPCWRIPFLRRLLERHQVEGAAEVEAKIEGQRALGWWSLSDGDFYSELNDYLVRRELLGQIKKLDETPPPGPVSELFKGDEPLSDTVLYVATFFPNLTPHEFNQLVPLLLAGAPQVADNGAATPPKDGAHEAAGVPGEKAPLQVWRQRPDQVLKKCELVTIPLRGATRGVNFTNHSLRGKLRGHLEREYSFFLENRFQAVQGLGLIFSPSPKISQSAVQLSVEMAASYPEYYGSRWLAGVVRDFESSFASADGARAPTWRLIEEANAAKARKLFYQSLSQLVRAMLEEPRLAEVIEEFLQQLLLSKQHGGVLEIVRRLQFAPAFDQFKWLKQLLHRGDQQIREQTSDYLRGYLKRTGGRVYQALTSLESWLPEGGRPLQTYPFPARYALRLLHFHLSETTFRFDARYFGSWPSACPLFAFGDADTAAGDLRLLVRLLFHPGMNGVFKEQRLNQEEGALRINRLVTTWFFILQGKGERSAHGRDNEAEGAEPRPDASMVSGLLLEQIVRTTTAPQRAALLAYWHEESRRTLKALSNKPYGSPAWEELAWKRDLIAELITRYEQLRSDAAGLQ
jgi:hypothetical protein